MLGRRARKTLALAAFRSSLLLTNPQEEQDVTMTLTGTPILGCSITTTAQSPSSASLPPEPKTLDTLIRDCRRRGMTYEFMYLMIQACERRRPPPFVWDIETITVPRKESSKSLYNTNITNPGAEKFTWDDFLTSLYQRTFSRVEYVSLGSQDDVQNKDQKVLYTFGEILPNGVDLLFTNGAILSKQPNKHEPQKEQKSRTRFYDLGAGLGRLALQVWLAYPEIDDVIAIEYSPSRFQVGLRALDRLAQLNEKAIAVVDRSDRSIILSMHTSYAQFLWPDDKKQEWPALVRATTAARTLTYIQGDLFTYCEQITARSNIVFIETDIPDSRVLELWQLLCQLRQGTRFLLYHPMDNLKTRARLASIPFLQFRRIGTFSTPTTWSPTLGAPFEVWEKI